MVPLKEAWRSGAWAWTTERRKAFANSLDDSQLWAVTDNVNQQKADRDPSVWKPPLESFYCEYARSWIDVKHDWGLSMQAGEKEALMEMLATC
ncbi:GmrSD restriction endonuclease domain-containing protein [Nonomuraea angiospora]